MVKSASLPADAVDNRLRPTHFFFPLAGSWREASRHSNNSLSMMSQHWPSILNDWGLQSAELVFTIFYVFNIHQVWNQIRKEQIFETFARWKWARAHFQCFVFWMLFLRLWKQDFTDDGSDEFKFQVRVTCRTLATTFNRRFHSVLSSYGDSNHGNKVEGSGWTYDVILLVNIQRSKYHFKNKNLTSLNYGSTSSFQLIGLTVYIWRKSGCVWLPPPEISPPLSWK